MQQVGTFLVSFLFIITQALFPEFAFPMIVNGSFTGFVANINTEGSGVMPGNIQAHDMVKVTFSYQTDDTSERMRDDWRGVYNFSPAYPSSWMQIEINDLVWKSASNFHVYVYNDYPPSSGVIWDRFHMGFEGAGSSFPGYMSEGEALYYVGGNYDSYSPTKSFLSSTALPTSINEFNLNDNWTYWSTVYSRSGQSGWQFDYTIERDTFHLNPVPIPGAVWLLCSGLAGIMGFKKIQRKRLG